ncbi:Hypothetical_protein [Hexamita inflata]|uniref:Hypothetical_protein n=1 Tax=Hexamita inflata TaxID=28002 RepID=A0ABP1L086_9EUKA
MNELSPMLQISVNDSDNITKIKLILQYNFYQKAFQFSDKQKQKQLQQILETIDKRLKSYKIFDIEVALDELLDNQQQYSDISCVLLATREQLDNFSREQIDQELARRFVLVNRQRQSIQSDVQSFKVSVKDLYMLFSDTARFNIYAHFQRKFRSKSFLVAAKQESATFKLIHAIFTLHFTKQHPTPQQCILFDEADPLVKSKYQLQPFIAELQKAVHNERNSFKQLLSNLINELKTNQDQIIESESRFYLDSRESLNVHNLLFSCAEFLSKKQTMKTYFFYPTVSQLHSIFTIVYLKSKFIEIIPKNVFIHQYVQQIPNTNQFKLNKRFDYLPNTQDVKIKLFEQYCGFKNPHGFFSTVVNYFLNNYDGEFTFNGSAESIFQTYCNFLPRILDASEQILELIKIIDNPQSNFMFVVFINESLPEALETPLLNTKNVLELTPHQMVLLHKQIKNNELKMFTDMIKPRTMTRSEINKIKCEKMKDKLLIAQEMVKNKITVRDKATVIKEHESQLQKCKIQMQNIIKQRILTKQKQIRAHLMLKQQYMANQAELYRINSKQTQSLLSELKAFKIKQNQLIQKTRLITQYIKYEETIFFAFKLGCVLRIQINQKIVNEYKK